MANISLDGKIVHAGLDHTYAYLFSTLKTKYGFKRDRWLNDSIENGFQIKSFSLRPWPIEGTLLSNLTYFIGQIVYQTDGDQKTLAKLNNIKKHTSSQLTHFNYSKLKSF